MVFKLHMTKLYIHMNVDPSYLSRIWHTMRRRKEKENVRRWERCNHLVLMNWTRCGSKWLWPNVRCSSGICLVILKKLTYPSVNTTSLLNSKHPTDKPRVIPNKLCLSRQETWRRDMILQINQHSPSFSQYMSDVRWIKRAHITHLIIDCVQTRRC